MVGAKPVFVETRCGIQTSVFYSIPLHLQTRYMKFLETKKGKYPIAEKV